MSRSPVHSTTVLDGPVGGVPTLPHNAYSIFTTKEKWLIVSMIAIAGLFSPLTANIYFPAIPTLVSEFEKSTELINLTVTVYMVVQGIAPMFWGTIADYWGRRPIFIACLAVLTLSCVGLALVPTSDYWLLMLLRCIQAAGSASTIALGAGVIGDISTRAERGGFFGLYSVGPMFGPTIGPVIGGALAGTLGWRSIFWFLCISSAACLIFIILFLPETLRSLVGDGSTLPPPIYRPLVPIIGRSRRKSESNDKPLATSLPNPLRIFTYPDVVTLLFFNATVYCVYYGVTATISTLFKSNYPFLSEIDIGLCFLASGGGMLLGGGFTGKLLDWDYRRIKAQVTNVSNTDTEKRLAPEDVTKEDKFPIEKARLRTMPIYLGFFIAACVGYGWCLQRQVSIAGPLALHVVLGYTFIAVMNTTQTLIVDLMPNQSSSVTACNNLVRCSLGAMMVSVIQLIIDRLTVGWTYVLLAGICLLVAPLIYVIIKIGPNCRAKRRQENEKELERQAS